MGVLRERSYLIRPLNKPRCLGITMGELFHLNGIIAASLCEFGFNSGRIWSYWTMVTKMIRSERDALILFNCMDGR